MKDKLLKNMLVPGLCALLAVALPALLIRLEIIDAYTAQILTLSAVNAIMALSVNMI